MLCFIRESEFNGENRIRKEAERRACERNCFFPSSGLSQGAVKAKYTEQSLLALQAALC